MKHMSLRRSGFVALAAAALPLAFASAAPAASTVTLSLKITPARKSPSPQHLRTVAVRPVLAYADSDPSRIVAPLAFTDVVLPKGFVLDASKPAKCQPTIVAPTVCPHASIIGAGGAEFVAALGDVKIPASTEPITKGGVPANHGVLAFYSGASKFFLLTNATKPVQDQRVFPGQLIKGARPVIRIPVYKIVAAGLVVSVTKFDAPINGVFKAPASCPKGGWKAQARTQFRTADGERPAAGTVISPATVKCS